MQQMSFFLLGKNELRHLQRHRKLLKKIEDNSVRLLLLALLKELEKVNLRKSTDALILLT